MAPRRGRRRRSWWERQRDSRRGRFELALIGGGLLALVLAGTLPGLDILATVVLLGLAGFCMAVLATVTGFIPAMVAAVFAPLVIALTDPMWALGAGFTEFALASETFWTFVMFTAAAFAGASFSDFRRRHRNRRSRGLWRAQPVARRITRAPRAAHEGLPDGSRRRR